MQINQKKKIKVIIKLDIKVDQEYNININESMKKKWKLLGLRENTDWKNKKNILIGRKFNAEEIYPQKMIIIAIQNVEKFRQNT